MAGERLLARFLLLSQLWFRGTLKYFETATSHMQTDVQKSSLRFAFCTSCGGLHPLMRLGSLRSTFNTSTDLQNYFTCKLRLQFVTSQIRRMLPATVSEHNHNKIF
jgi:hypothetical protein